MEITSADEDAEGLETLAAMEIEKDRTWTPQQNILYGKAFPVSLLIPLTWLEQTIESISVNDNTAVNDSNLVV